MTSAAAAHRELRRVSPVFLGLAAVTAVSGWCVWEGFAKVTGFAVFLFVVSGWIVSLCLHEYAHARSALHGGDLSVAEKGYLTLNPLRYTHALLSVVLPVLFVIMGGIGLPGGAVYVERGRIPERWKHSVISAAGPLTNLVLALLLTAPWWLGLAGGMPVAFRCAVAFLALLQVTAAILNSLPVPGLDGYGVIEPWLSPAVRRQAAPWAPFGMLIVFGVLWIPEVNAVFWDGIDAVLRVLGVSPGESFFGQQYFRFWEGEPGAAVLGWSPAG